MQSLASNLGISFDSFALPPTNSPSPNNDSEDSFPEHDLLNLDDFNNLGQNGQRKTKRPPSTAERRATHNAVERARRESLNGRFMELASALPNMASVKRPSKSVIVAKSLEYVQGAQAREQYLMSQNDALRAELNELRARLGMPAVAASPMPSHAASLPARARKASSVSSNATDSPATGTPATLSNSSLPDVAPVVRNPPGYTFNAAFANAFPDLSNAQVQAQPTAVAGSVSASMPNSKPSTPPATYANQVPGLDVNYLMALSLQQQQQQQNMLHLQNMPPSYAAVAPWLMSHNPAVAVGGDSSWLFS